LAGACSARNDGVVWVCLWLHLFWLIGRADVFSRVGVCWGLVGSVWVANASLLASLFVLVGCMRFVECSISSVFGGRFLLWLLLIVWSVYREVACCFCVVVSSVVVFVSLVCGVGRWVLMG